MMHAPALKCYDRAGKGNPFREALADIPGLCHVFMPIGPRVACLMGRQLVDKRAAYRRIADRTGLLSV